MNFRVTGRDNGKHRVEFADGSITLVDDAELKALEEPQDSASSQTPAEATGTEEAGGQTTEVPKAKGKKEVTPPNVNGTTTEVNEQADGSQTPAEATGTEEAGGQ